MRKEKANIATFFVLAMLIMIMHARGNGEMSAVSLGTDIAYGYGHEPPPPPPPPASSTAGKAPSRGVPASDSNRAASVASSSVAPPTSVPSGCGNGIVEKTEECDLGTRLNGIKTCSKQCMFLVCGDDSISAQAGEECEPRKIDVDYTDPDTGESYTESEFLTPSCGTYCMPPVCDGITKKCTGGCRWKFQDRCPSDIEILSEDFFTSRGSRLKRRASSAQSFSSAFMTSQLPEKKVSAPVSASCGDGVVNNNEICDQGAFNSDSIPNACRTSCALPTCGDGVADTLFGEICDQGLENSNDVPDTCRLTCTPPICGDGVKDSNEDCDGSESCPAECKESTSASTAHCGNAILEPGEECDDGNALSDDGCSNLCNKTKGDSLCGNGKLDVGEECDDENLTESDGCSSSCMREAALSLCGNGTVEVEEECDEGTRNSNSVADRCRQSCSKPSCGDGVRDSEEECDDGNDTETDACTTLCALPVCGDGIVSLREECDDGNDVSGDGCSLLCVLEKPGSSSEKGESKIALFIVFIITSLTGFIAGAFASIRWLRV